MTAKEFIDSKEWTQATVHFSINDVVDLMQEYARLKCLEAIKNTRHKACDKITEFPESIPSNIGTLVIQSIQNIPDKEVMPEL